MGEWLTAARRETASTVSRLATPIVLANLLAWAVGFADVLMVSRLGEEALAGLGMANQVFFLVVIFILAVTTGTMVLVARYKGAADEDAASFVFRQSLLLAAAQSVVIAAVGVAVTPWMLAALGATGGMADAGTVYLRIIFIGVAAPIVDFTIASTFRGAGDSMTPLKVAGMVAALNIAGNYLLIFGPGPFPALGIAGAALSTVIARAFGAWWGWRKLAAGRGGMRLRPGDWRPDPTMMRRILRIGVPSAFEGVLRAGSGVVFLAVIARTGAGAAAVAAHTVGLQLESLARMPAFGISVAATAIVGQRLGARDPDGAESAGWTSTVLGLALIGGIAVLLFAFARPVARLFTDDPETLALTVRYLRILAVAQPAFLAGVVLSGALRGGGDTGFPTWAGFLSGWVFMLPVAYAAAIVMGLGPAAAWMAQAGSYLVTAVLVGFRFRGGRWKHIAV